MKKKYVVILSSVVIIFLAIGFTLLFNSLKPKPYKVYPNTFQQRGMQEALDNYSPKTMGDTIHGIEMLILQKSDEQAYNRANSKPDIEKLLAGIGAIMVSFVSIGKILYDSSASRAEKRHMELISGQEDMKAELKTNAEQHLQIFDGLKVVYDTKAREVVTEALKHICEKHIYFKKGLISEELTFLINSQTDRLISLSEEIMTPNFNNENYALAEVKIEERNRIAWKQIIELFGSEFLDNYKVVQKISVDKFKANLRDLAEKRITNSKYDQYRAIAELFLHDIIEHTLWEYNRYKSL